MTTNQSVMIALVSDQRMQNVIPILQQGASYGNLTLVLSRDRKTGKPMARYIKSAKDLKTVLEPYVAQVTISDEYVDPYDIEKVRTCIQRLLQNETMQDQVVVNISGGTKPMAIGALQAAQAEQVESLYTDMEDGEILWLSPDGSTRSEAISVHNISVEIYIRAYGEKVAQSTPVENLTDQQIEWASLIGNNHKVVYQSVIVPVNRSVFEARRAGGGLPVRQTIKSTRRSLAVVEALANAGLWSWHPDTQEIELSDEASARFLNGIWVEVYTALKLKQSGVFDDVRLNVTLEGLDGEIDVAAVSNGKLVLIECKSNIQATIQLGKLDSFRYRLGGPFAKAYYARASEAEFRRIKSQCEKFRLDGVFFGAELGQIGDEIGKLIGKTT